MEKELLIESVAREAREYEGEWSRGFKCEGTWYNIRGKTKEEINNQFTEELISTGNKVKAEIDQYAKNNVVSKIELIEKRSRKMDDDMMNLDKLLDDAHRKGLLGIKTEMLQVDWEKKNALFKATVTMLGKDIETKDGEVATEKEFEGHGDATEENLTNEHIKPHFIRMAETRSICRALRWATNNAEVTEEEKG